VAGVAEHSDVPWLLNYGLGSRARQSLCRSARWRGPAEDRRRGTSRLPIALDEPSLVPIPTPTPPCHVTACVELFTTFRDATNAT
jgi:hypothetical protein